MSGGRVVLVSAIALAVAVVAAASLVVVLRLRSPLPAATLHLTAPVQLVLAPGVAPPVPAPSVGGFLLQDSDGTAVSATAADTPRPIASVAKVMAALVTLQAFPLAAGADGPMLTLTRQDEAFYRQELAGGGSVISVNAGETLTERQLLLALLLPSANNIADTLAVWVSGNVAAFVTRENGAAAALGMSLTHFADPTGVSASTVSTPRDLIRLAIAALAVPALADLVQTQQATLPDGTALRNLDILLATNADWLGLKTGWTAAAGGCLLFAARHVYPDARSGLTLYGAVLGQPAYAEADADHPELGGAFAVAGNAESAAVGGYEPVNLAGMSPANGIVSTPWGARSGVVSQAAQTTVLARLGQQVAVAVTLKHLAATPHAGSVVAVLSTTAVGGVHVSWSAVTTEDIAGPDWWWHLLHG